MQSKLYHITLFLSMDLDNFGRKSHKKDFFATKACKAAVKGGQELSNNEVDSLLNQIVDNKTTLLCPHGRPVCVKIEKSQIEKMFKRKL